MKERSLRKLSSKGNNVTPNSKNSVSKININKIHKSQPYPNKMEIKEPLEQFIRLMSNTLKDNSELESKKLWICKGNWTRVPKKTF